MNAWENSLLEGEFAEVNFVLRCSDEIEHGPEGFKRYGASMAVACVKAAWLRAGLTHWVVCGEKTSASSFHPRVSISIASPKLVSPTIERVILPSAL